MVNYTEHVLRAGSAVGGRRPRRPEERAANHVLGEALAVRGACGKQVHPVFEGFLFFVFCLFFSNLTSSSLSFLEAPRSPARSGPPTNTVRYCRSRASGTGRCISSTPGRRAARIASRWVRGAPHNTRPHLCPIFSHDRPTPALNPLVWSRRVGVVSPSLDTFDRSAAPLLPSGHAPAGGGLGGGAR